MALGFLVVNINDASVEKLQQIKGLGPKLAIRIVQFREENGHFNSVEDIMKIRGIGEAKFERIKEYLEV